MRNYSKIKVATSDSVLRAILREALAGEDETAGQSGRDDKQQKQSTIPQSLPITPTQQMATQLSTQRPPVEDPEFVPANQEELGRSLAALSSLVRTENIGKFYREFVNLIDNVGVADEEEEEPYDMRSDRMA